MNVFGAGTFSFDLAAQQPQKVINSFYVFVLACSPGSPCHVGAHSMKQNLCQMEKALREALETHFQIACAVWTSLKLQEQGDRSDQAFQQPACLFSRVCTVQLLIVGVQRRAQN